MASLRFVVPVVVIAALACTAGVRLQEFAPAHAPAGVAISLQLKSRRPEVHGELLALGDSALFVLRDDGRIVAISYQVIDVAQCAQMAVVLYGGHPPQGSTARELRDVSRYPQGMSPDLLARLLAAYGQSEVERMTP